MNHSGPVFITGGSGFVGRHIVQLLAKHGYQVRLLARRAPERPLDPSVEVVLGDLTQPESYADRLRGVSAVVHAALTGTFSEDVEATLSLEKFSARAGVGKFIHLSSIVVNGIRPEGVLTEETPPVPASDAYSRAKLAIEEGLLKKREVPELLILRLGCVYGPGGGWWSNSLLDLMERGKMILVNDGAGTANLIHVADVASVVLSLLGRGNSPVEIFNITDGMPISWKAYFCELEGILGRSATVPMTVAEALRYWEKWGAPSLPRRAMRKLMRAEVIHPLDSTAVHGYASRGVYSNEKVSRMLGFRPMYDLKSGMETVRLDRQARSRAQ